MSRLIFNARDVKRVAAHSINSQSQNTIADYATATAANGWTPKRHVPDEPHVILVHDDGVYLMSNGQPRDLVRAEHSFVAYAQGCHPKKDANWWDTSRDLVGYDDFSEFLPWARELLELVNSGAKQVIIEFSDNEIRIDR